MKLPLTKKQTDVLEFVEQHINIYDKAPTLTEIALEFEFSIPMAHKYLSLLKKRGYIERKPAKWRGIKVVKNK